MKFIFSLKRASWPLDGAQPYFCPITQSQAVLYHGDLALGGNRRRKLEEERSNTINEAVGSEGRMARAPRKVEAGGIELLMIRKALKAEAEDEVMHLGV